MFGLQITKKLLLLGEALDYEELKVTNFFDFYCDNPENIEIILNDKIKQLSNLSLESIKTMKASIYDYKYNNINIENEIERFQSGFESGLILDKINKLRAK